MVDYNKLEQIPRIFKRCETRMCTKTIIKTIKQVQNQSTLGVPWILKEGTLFRVIFQ